MKKIVTFLIAVYSTFTFSQTVKVEGTVKDSLNNPLELANIIAFIKGTKKIEFYSITNEKGNYKLILPINTSYSLRISYLGYETKELEIDIPNTSSKINKDYILKEEVNSLDGVELTFEMPVTIHGDTIVYNADSFTNGNEKKLEDVLKKLPGVEIDENGEIKVEGKKINKVMVEGKDFFDGDSKIASKNIPANAVDKIEVLRNYNEVSPMRGIGDDSDNIAINIKLKEGKKNFWFGEISAGSGTDNGYIAHPKLFYYSPKTSVNIITNVNNIGEVPFTIQDYFRFTGGFKNLMRRSGTSFSTGQNDLGFSMMQNDRAKKIDSKFAAFNFSYNPKKHLTLSGFSIFNDSEVEMKVENKIDNIVTGSIEERDNLMHQRTQLGMAKLSLNYVPSLNTYLDYDIFIKKSKQSETELTHSTVNGNNENIENKKNQKPSSINQNFTLYKVLNDENIFSIKIQQLYQNANPFMNYIRNIQPFQSIIPIQAENNYNISQQKNISTNKLDAKLDYYFIINKKSNLKISLGSSLSFQNFDSNIFQTLNNDTQINFNELNLNNDVSYTFTDIFLGLHYKSIVGKFTFNPGLTVHNYITKDKQLGTTNKNSEFNITPDLSVILKLKRSETLRFYYSMSRRFTDINKLSEGYIFNNYNSLFKGNRNLESALYQNISLSYFNFSMYNFTNINASINYSNKIDAIKNESNFTGFNQTINKPYNSNLADETISGHGSYGRKFGKFKVNTNFKLNYSRYNGIVNNNLNLSESFTQKYKISFATNFKTAPNLEIGYVKTFNQYSSTTTKNEYTIDRPFAKLDVIISKSFSFLADYSYYKYANKDHIIQNNYSFLNASLYFQKPDSKWEFILSGKNLTDNKSINRDIFSENYTRTSRYFVQKKRFLLTVKYNL